MAQAIGPEGMTAPKNVVDKTAVEANTAKTPAADLHPVGWLGRVGIDLIEVGDIALRPAQTDSEEFAGLKASIAAEGITDNLLVMHSPEIPGKYRLINGLQRLTIAQMLGLTEIPILVKTADEAKVHSLQIQTNLHRVATKPAQFGASIVRYMALRESAGSPVTVVDLAQEFNVSTTWINDRIGIAKHLLPEIAASVDEGEITASAAVQLSKLPAAEQMNYVSRAVALPISEFAEVVSTRKKEINEAKKAGGPAPDPVFTPISRQRKKAECEVELEKHVARAEFVTKDMTALQAWDEAIKWTLQLDPASVEVEREKWEAEKKGREERAIARAAAQAAKKAEKGGAAEDAAAAALAAAE